MNANKQIGKRAFSAGLIIFTIIIAVLNLIIFTIFKPLKLETNHLKLIFWFSYGFMMLAYVLQVVSIFAGRYENGVESVFFSIPMYKVAIFYFAVAAVLSLLFMILVSFGVAVPFMLMFILEIIVLAVFAIAFVLSYTHKNVVLDIDKNIKANVFKIRTLVTDVEVLAEAVNDNAALKAKLARLAEDIRYSDPMTNDSVKDLDLQMRDLVAELELVVSEKDYAQAETLIRQATLTMSKRNKRLADGK